MRQMNTPAQTKRILVSMHLGRKLTKAECHRVDVLRRDGLKVAEIVESIRAVDSRSFQPERAGDGLMPEAAAAARARAFGIVADGSE